MTYRPDSVLTLLVLLMAVLWAAGAAVSEVDIDDPRLQIAQWNNEHGQLKGYPATGDEDELPVYDDVSKQMSDEEVSELELSENPEFPPALEFNSERNRIHKRLPIPDEDDHLPQMIHIADGA